MIVIIAISSLAFILETEYVLMEAMSHQFDIIEVRHCFGMVMSRISRRPPPQILCISVFTFDLSARALLAPNYRQFWKDVYNWIDLVAIVPFFAVLVFPEHSVSSVY